MCGILIIFSKKGKKLSKSKSLRASKEIYNTGPDSFKFEFGKNWSQFLRLLNEDSKDDISRETIRDFSVEARKIAIKR